jgi:hypothetical protein
MTEQNKYVLFTYSTNSYYIKYGTNGEPKLVARNKLTNKEIEAAFKMTGHWHKVG